MKSTIKGMAHVQAALSNLSKSIPDAAIEATRDTTKEIHKVSTEDFCPVDKGLLKSTGKIDEEVSKNKYKAIISYGTEYAVYVHEIPYYHHPHGSWKYLEIPFKQISPKLPKNIESAIRGKI